MAKLGKTQTSVLATLKSRGRWYDGCGWIWTNYSETTRVMNSLVKHGLVVATDETFKPVIGPVYTRTVYRAKETACT